MSRSDDGKCPDIGNWCSYPREICEGTCLTKEMEDLRSENERLKAEINLNIQELVSANEEIKILHGDSDKLVKENKKLRDALKPVLECDCWIKRSNRGSIIMDGMEKALDAITEAKRIYNGGVK